MQQTLRNEDYVRLSYDVGYLSKLVFNIDPNRAQRFIPDRADENEPLPLTNTRQILGDIYGP